MVKAVYELLGVEARPRLTRMLQSCPGVIEDADDMCQLAVLAFVEACRERRIRPDAATGRHTEQSVAGYLWGICNRIFINAVRRRQLAFEILEDDGAFGANAGGGLLDELVPNGVAESEEGQLWEVLSAVTGRCRPEHIIMTYMHCSGFTIGELQTLLGVSINTPGKAVKRVGGELRDMLGLKLPDAAPEDAPRQPAKTGALPKG